MLREKAEAWIQMDPDETTQRELKELLESGDETELRDRFRGRLSFGTAGLRGVMGAGPNRMNRLVIRQSARGLAEYLLKVNPASTELGVVVAYDGRLQSQKFAEDCACVLAAFGFKVHLSKGPLPTPICAYALKAFGCAAGAMVTASHNPPEYNGFKVYWGNGAQIVPPHDTGISDAIISSLNRTIPMVNLDEALAKGMVSYFGPELFQAYLSQVSILTGNATSSTRNNLVLAYTPLHGVGAEAVEMALRLAGFTENYTVAAQRRPDGHFPTVRFPNPEEPGAMDAVLELARNKGAHLAFANDPDADRLAVAVRRSDSTYRMLTGNEIGVLLGFDLINGYPTNACVGTTIVSSRLLGTIAEAHHVECFEVLTGFKWIANGAMERELKGKRFLMGYEEALGYTIGNLVRDKDGVSALVAFALLAARLHQQGTDVLELLEKIYRKYGYYATTQVSLKLDPSAESPSLGDTLRAHQPSDIFGQSVVRIDDLRSSIRHDLSNSTQTNIDLPTSDVLSYFLSDGSRIIVRPSGTEPKVKFYYEIIEMIDGDESFHAAKSRADERLAELVASHQAQVEQLCS